MTVLRFVEVSKRYRAGDGELINAADGVSLTVEKGELVALYGPSGSGKTTLLELAAALRSPDSGSITVDGVELAALSPRDADAYRLHSVGYVFQDFHLIPGVSAADNAAVKLLAGPVPLADARRRASPWLERVGLGHRRGALPQQLSGGERQRVAIAAALANEPPLIPPSASWRRARLARLAPLAEHARQLAQRGRQAAGRQLEQPGAQQERHRLGGPFPAVGEAVDRRLQAARARPRDERAPVGTQQDPTGLGGKLHRGWEREPGLERVGDLVQRVGPRALALAQPGRASDAQSRDRRPSAGERGCEHEHGQRRDDDGDRARDDAGQRARADQRDQGLLDPGVAQQKAEVAIHAKPRRGTLARRTRLPEQQERHAGGECEREHEPDHDGPSPSPRNDRTSLAGYATSVLVVREGRGPPPGTGPVATKLIVR